MTEVEIQKENGLWQVLIDGVDMAPAIAAGGLRVEFRGGAEADFPLVHVTFRARTFTADLPGAVVRAREELLTSEEPVA